jgi:DNA-directed RNA polymerase specialized sigma24 family protein
MLASQGSATMTVTFPTTHATWLTEQIRTAPAEARAHVMKRYFEPLCAYARVSSPRLLGEPAELVNDFLATRVADDAYLARWTASGLPLRRWLANGLVIHARNAALASRRRNDLLARTSLDEAEQAAAMRASEHDTAALLALERAWAIRIVTEAHEQIRTELQAEGRGAWWELFRLHSVHGMRYAQAGPIVGIPVSSASSAHRQVVDRLRAALVAILERDGIRPDEIEHELASLQELLG